MIKLRCCFIKLKLPGPAEYSARPGSFSGICLGLQICLIEIRGIKEIGNIDLQALADLVDHTKFYRIIRTVDDVTDGGLWNTALHIELILRHAPLAQKLLQSRSNRFIQLHAITTPFL